MATDPGKGDSARVGQCYGGEYSGFTELTGSSGDTAARNKKEKAKRKRYDPTDGAEGRDAADVAREYLATVKDGTCKSDGEMVRFFEDSGEETVSRMVQVRDVEYDGSCLFHAVKASAKGIDETADEIRRAAVGEIEEHPERYQHAIQTVPGSIRKKHSKAQAEDRKCGNRCAQNWRATYDRQRAPSTGLRTY